MVAINRTESVWERWSSGDAGTNALQGDDAGKRTLFDKMMVMELVFSAGGPNAVNAGAFSAPRTNNVDLLLVKCLSPFNSGSAEIQVLLYHSLPFNTMKLN